eukprot:COSAG05_NODE_183_length_14758_cov_90.142506_4_plen_243_part_00
MAAVQLLVRAGSRLETVRLSQTRGPGVRKLVTEALQKAGTGAGDADAPEPVGYARVQQRSNAFYGPRRTPISGKLKKQLLRQKREKKSSKLQDQESTALPGAVNSTGINTKDHMAAQIPRPDKANVFTAATTDLSYADTVRAVKKSRARKVRGRKKAAISETQDMAPADINHGNIKSVPNFAGVDSGQSNTQKGEQQPSRKDNGQQQQQQQQQQQEMSNSKRKALRRQQRKAVAQSSRSLNT